MKLFYKFIFLIGLGLFSVVTGCGYLSPILSDSPEKNPKPQVVVKTADSETEVKFPLSEPAVNSTWTETPPDSPPTEPPSSSPPALISASPSSPTVSSTGSSSPSPDYWLSINYYFTAEVAYIDLSITDDKIKCTYFDASTSHIPDGPIASVPYWTHSQLKTKEATLTPQEVQELKDFINQNKDFFQLPGVCGGAEEYQRYYSYSLSVELEKDRNSVTYQSFPEAKPRPDSFKNIEDYILNLMHKKLSVSAPI